jgi:hypothetical protein
VSEKANLPDPSQSDQVFVTLVRSEEGRQRASLLVESLRSFGGDLKDKPVLVYDTDYHAQSEVVLKQDGVFHAPLVLPSLIEGYFYADKVFACAEAEREVAPNFSTLTWIATDCLILQAPTLFRLQDACLAALRPVHIQNIGLEIVGSIDAYWEKVYLALGVEDVSLSVNSFVDGKHLRAYFNSHAFSVDSRKGWMVKWLDQFCVLATDPTFQSQACADDLHKVFLHQAVLSTLLATSIEKPDLRILPPEYNYPYNLQPRLPPDRQATSLDELVCIAYENRSLDPRYVTDIQIKEPYLTWLQEHLPAT